MNNRQLLSARIVNEGGVCVCSNFEVATVAVFSDPPLGE